MSYRYNPGNSMPSIVTISAPKLGFGIDHIPYAKRKALETYREEVPLETRFKHWVLKKKLYVSWAQHLRRWCEIYRDTKESFKARELALAYYQNEVKPNLVTK